MGKIIPETKEKKPITINENRELEHAKHFIHLSHQIIKMMVIWHLICPESETLPVNQR